MKGRTDMAEELHDSLKEACDRSGGIISELYAEDGVKVSRISVISSEGAEAIGKPCGTYITLTAEKNWHGDAAAVRGAAKCIAKYLRPLIPEKGEVMVVGLGNRFITPDSLGPAVTDRIIVTRHLASLSEFSLFRPVCAINAGVLGCTGIETAEIVKGVCGRVRPCAVIAIDSLASLSVSRLCRTFQISDTGIVPGAGAFNARRALDRETLGIPVIALGVPTVVDADTIVSDVLKRSVGKREKSELSDFLVTPKDIDALITKSARALSDGINMAIQGKLAEEDIAQLSDS